MRRGIIGTVLNVIVTLLAIGVVFSAAFYVYNSFIANMQKSEAVLAFEKFVEPISKACNGEERPLGFNIRLPTTDPNYVYGIFQTRLSSDKAYYQNEKYKIPQIMLEKCTDSYCLCLFQMRRKLWSSWMYKDENGKQVFSESDAAPLWHFNTPGMVALRKLMPLILYKFFTRVAISIIIYVGVPILISLLSACTPETPHVLITCPLAYGVLYAISGFFLEFFTQLKYQTMEPMVFYNFPQNLMTQSNKDNLEWKRNSGRYDCDYYMKQEWFQVLIDVVGDAFSAATSYAINKFFDGLLRGVGKGFKAKSKAMDASDEFLELAKLPEIEATAKLGFGSQVGSAMAKQLTYAAKYSSKVYKITKYAFKAAIRFASISKYPLKRQIAQFILKTPTPLELSPQCKTAEVLAKRQIVDLDCFTGPSDPLEWIKKGNLEECEGKYGRMVAPVQTYDKKVYDMYPGDLSIITCVSIDELGPECGKDDAVKLITDSDYFLLYRLTDPVNQPYQAIYCGYAESEEDYEFNVFKMALCLGQPDCTWPAPWDTLQVTLNWILDIVVGDILLAGQHSAKGLFIDCVIPQVVDQWDADYFQYWVPYPDVSNIYGSDGQIFMMVASKTPQRDYADILNCKWDVLDEMAKCIRRDDIYRACVKRCEEESGCEEKYKECTSPAGFECFAICDTNKNKCMNDCDIFDIDCKISCISELSKCLGECDINVQEGTCEDKFSKCNNNCWDKYPLLEEVFSEDRQKCLSKCAREKTLCVSECEDEKEDCLDDYVEQCIAEDANCYDPSSDISGTDLEDKSLEYYHDRANMSSYWAPDNHNFTKGPDSGETCFDAYINDYLECEPGLYIELLGVLK